MTEVTKICDDCGGRVDWLYNPPRIIVEELTLGYYNSKIELCKNCMKRRCENWNNTVNRKCSDAGTGKDLEDGTE